MADLGNLVVKLSADTSNLSKNLAKAKQDVDAFSAKSAIVVGVIGGALAVGFEKAVSSILDTAKAINKAFESAQNLGISLKSLERLSFIAERGGTNLDAIITGTTRLAKGLEEMKDNAKKAAQELENLGKTRQKELDQAAKDAPGKLTASPNSLAGRKADPNSLAGRAMTKANDTNSLANRGKELDFSDYENKADEINSRYNEQKAEMESKAADSTDGAAAALAKLGISADAFLKLPIDKQFYAIAEAMEKLDNQQQKTAIAIALYGRGGAPLLGAFRDAKSQGEAFDKTKAGTSDVSAAKLKELDDGIAAIALKWENTKKQIALGIVDLLGSLSKLPDRLESLKENPSLKNFVTGQDNPNKSLSQVAGESATGLKSVARDVATRVQQIFNINVEGNTATVQQQSGAPTEVQVNVKQTAQDTARQVAR